MKGFLGTDSSRWIINKWLYRIVIKIACLYKESENLETLQRITRKYLVYVCLACLNIQLYNNVSPVAKELENKILK